MKSEQKLEKLILYIRNFKIFLMKILKIESLQKWSYKSCGDRDNKKLVVVDCKAKMEAMIPVEEFSENNEISKIKVGSAIEIYLERIESFKGEIIVSRDKARKLKAWKKWKRFLKTRKKWPH